MKMSNNEIQSVFIQTALDVLRNACLDPKNRASVLQNPKDYLFNHGVNFTESNDIWLVENLPLPQNDHSLQIPKPINLSWLDQHYEIKTIPPALEKWWKSTHKDCSFGTYPYNKKITVCDIWAVFKTGEEYVKSEDNSSDGHFEAIISPPVCVSSHIIDRQVCLPWDPDKE